FRLLLPLPSRSSLFPYTTLFRSPPADEPPGRPEDDPAAGVGRLRGDAALPHRGRGAGPIAAPPRRPDLRRRRPRRPPVPRPGVQIGRAHLSTPLPDQPRLPPSPS